MVEQTEEPVGEIVPTKGKREKKFRHDEICELVKSYQHKRNITPGYTMEPRLGKIIQMMTDSVINSPSFNGYSPDWKEQFRDRAYDHVFSYAVMGFKPDEVKDAYNYFCTVITNACIQVIQRNKRIIEKNPEIEFIDLVNHSDVQENEYVIKDPYGNEYRDEIVTFSTNLMTAYGETVKDDPLKNLAFRITRTSLYKSKLLVAKQFSLPMSQLNAILANTMNDIKVFYLDNDYPNKNRRYRHTHKASLKHHHLKIEDIRYIRNPETTIEQICAKYRMGEMNAILIKKKVFWGYIK